MDGLNKPLEQEEIIIPSRRCGNPIKEEKKGLEVSNCRAFRDKAQTIHHVVECEEIMRKRKYKNKMVEKLEREEWAEGLEEEISNRSAEGRGLRILENILNLTVTELLFFENCPKV